MRLALHKAKMAKEGFSCATIKEIKYLTKKPCGKVREEKKPSIECPGHNKVKAAIQGHLAMLHQNQTSGCLSCHNGTSKNPQTLWRRKETGAPPPVRRRVRTPEPTLPPPSMPSAPTGNSAGAQQSEIINLLAGCTYSHTAIPCAEFFEADEDTAHDTDFHPDMLTDDD
jgi:hypothetical protein